LPGIYLRASYAVKKACLTKKLIINADDFGIAEGINEGIIECYTRGAVTDMSLLAVGDSFQHAVGLAKKNNINKMGVHLALTGSFKSILDEAWKFPASYASFLAGYFTGKVPGKRIYGEFKKQIQKVKKEGFQISHLDSHQYIHMVPGILKNVIKLMKEEDIRHIRFPLEKISISTRLLSPSAWWRNIMLSSACRASGRMLESAGIKHNDFFIGHVHAHKLKRKSLLSIIRRLKSGVTELACHPGRFTDDVKKAYPQYRNCEEELEILCDKDFIDGIKAGSVELVSY